MLRFEINNSWIKREMANNWIISKDKKYILRSISLSNIEKKKRHGIHITFCSCNMLFTSQIDNSWIIIKRKIANN